MKNLVAAGAKAAVGSLENPLFLMAAFKNADDVYVILPTNFVADDFRKFQNEIAKCSWCIKSE